MTNTLRTNHRRSARLPLAVLALVLCSGCSSDDDDGDSGDALSEDVCVSAPVDGFGFDRYGGWKGIERGPSRRFRVEQVDGVWWLITPDGHALFSNGPTGVGPIGDTIRDTGRSPYHEAVLAKHGSDEAWARSTLARLCELGIRSFGGWMGPGELDLFAGQMPYTVNVDFYQAMPEVPTGPASVKARRDVFDPRAATLAAQLAAPGGPIARCAADPWCIGVYNENEVPYAPSILAGGTHLDVYLSMTAGAPGKRAVQELFAARYAQDIEAFNAVWGTDLTSFAGIQELATFGGCEPVFGYLDDLCYLDEPPARFADRLAFEAHVAARIAALGAEVLDAADPEMLNLGPRLVVAPFAREVVEALAAPVDVVSVNNYDVRATVDALLDEEQKAKLAASGLLSLDPFERLHELAEITGKPVLVTEWFYRRARPDVPSYPPFLPEVADGPAQATAYQAYMEQLLAMPFVVGEHWFQWQDQPIEGRFDGENQLIGIVDITDELNQPLASTTAAVNASIVARRHALNGD